MPNATLVPALNEFSLEVHKSTNKNSMGEVFGRGMLRMQDEPEEGLKPTPREGSHAGDFQ